MKIKYAIIVVIALVVIAVAIGLKMFYKPHDDINKMKPDFKVQASELIDEFEKQEDASSAKYDGKVLEINGKVSSKNQLPNGITVLMLEDEMQGISCQLDSGWVTGHRAVIESLEPGKSVTVKGVCKGYLMEIKVSPAVVVAHQ
ncbi:MAG: OB-fold protein [Candidatus Saccharibacteria bacterium]